MAITKLPRSGIADNSINASKIEDGTVAIAEVSGTISNAKLKDGEIANAKLSNSTITIRGVSKALGTSVTIGVDVDWQSKITSDGSTVTTMVAQRGYFVDNSSAAGIVKLPTSATAGDTIKIKDYAGNFGTNVLVIQRNGHNIQGVANDGQIQTNRASLTLVYVDSTKGWLYVDEHNVADLQKPIHTEATGGTVTTSGDYKIHTFTGDGNFVVPQVGNGPTPVSGGGPNTVSYLVIAGGGGGGGHAGSNGGGGGAGGFREGRDIGPSYTASPLVNSSGLTITAQTYPISVGGGGTSNFNSTSGSNSVFSTITSTGGGGGSSGYTHAAAKTGGSGGGGSSGSHTPGANGNTPPVSPPQGNNGGNGQGGCGYAGAGGGGAGAVGAQGGPNSYGSAGGAGGAGSTTHITGSPVTRAGGGGGFSYAGAGGAGGSGGGGAGGRGANSPAPTDTNATDGTANTGSGGGGRAIASAPGGGGGGGKGLVVIRYKFQ